MFRQLKLATLIAVAVSTVGTMRSADAHIGGRGGAGGGGIRIGGALIPRARQGNANGIRNGGNAGVARGNTPAPKAAVPPPVVQSGGTNSKRVSPPVTISNKTNNPSTGTAITNNSATKSKALENKPQSDSVQTPVAASLPSKPIVAVEPQPTKPDDAVTTEVARKEAALPQIPIGATVTLDGKDLSDRAGQVVLQIGDIALPATIKEWKNDAVICTLPVLGLTKASKATLHILKADGKIASTMEVELVTVLPSSPDAKLSSIDSAKLGP
ncbi:hypothetical protein NA78x_000252 [Anatilimnocola sp. NA78]|uniref:hypothetical protein n=1 Tax=Anatilimnocola sp. NA78 TaxID=3415683 RepID=UPI003CE5013A